MKTLISLRCIKATLTDYFKFAYVYDVIVENEYRGAGACFLLGKKKVPTPYLLRFFGKRTYVPILLDTPSGMTGATESPAPPKIPRLDTAEPAPPEIIASDAIGVTVEGKFNS